MKIKRYVMILLLIFTMNTFPQPALTVGGKNFTEQYLLAELVKHYLAQYGYSIKLQTGLTTSIVRQALISGNIDLYFEYVGTAYLLFYGKSDPDILTRPY